MLVEVALVGHYTDLHLLVRVIPQLLQPIVQIIERFTLCDVENEQGPHSLSIVSSSDASIALAACRIPNLCLDDGVVGQDDPLGEELNANR